MDYNQPQKKDDDSENLMCWKITLMDLFILSLSCCCAREKKTVHKNACEEAMVYQCKIQ